MRRCSILLLLGLGALLFFQGCRREEKAKMVELCDELRNSVMMTPVFDSLVASSSKLPKFLRAKVLLVAGTSYSMRKEELKKAKEYLKEAYRIGPREVKNQASLELVRLYGTLVLRDDCVEEAIHFIGNARARVVFVQEEEAEFYFLKARFYKSIDIERAFDAIDKSIAMYRGLGNSGKEIEMWCFKATLHGVLEEFEEQYACYEEAYRLWQKLRSKKDVRPFFEQMAASLKRLGRYEEALQWYGEVLKNVPDSSFGRYGIQIAEAYTGLGKHEQARYILKQALGKEERPGLRNTLLGRIADSYLKEEMRDSALVYFKAAVDLYDQYAREKGLRTPRVSFANHLKYARCLWDDGEQAEAIGHLEEVSRKKAEAPENLRAQMDILEQLGEYYAHLENKEALYGAFRRHDSIMNLYQVLNEDGRYRNVLQKYKNRKLLQEIEMMSRKQEETNWWLIFSLVVTIGMLGVIGIYSWGVWSKIRDKKR